MYRVISSYRNGSSRPVRELGPWHPSRQDAEFWAQQLNIMGYITAVESQHGLKEISESDNSDLAQALASMA